MKYFIAILMLFSVTVMAGGVDEVGLFPKLDPAPFAGNPWSMSIGLADQGGGGVFLGRHIATIKDTGIGLEVGYSNTGDQELYQGGVNLTRNIWKQLYGQVGICYADATVDGLKQAFSRELKTSSHYKPRIRYVDTDDSDAGVCGHVQLMTDPNRQMYGFIRYSHYDLNPNKGVQSPDENKDDGIIFAGIGLSF